MNLSATVSPAIADILYIMSKPIAEMSIAELTAAALATDNRQLSIAYTRMASAKEALALGDRETARKYADASKVAWLRSQEDAHGQLARVAAVEAVNVAAGVAQDATKVGGKHVVRLGMGKKAAVWADHWYAR